MKVEPVYKPARFLFLVPIWALLALFEDPWIGFWFGILMVFITSKMFPWVEGRKVEEKE